MGVTLHAGADARREDIKMSARLAVLAPTRSSRAPEWRSVWGRSFPCAVSLPRALSDGPGPIVPFQGSDCPHPVFIRFRHLTAPAFSRELGGTSSSGRLACGGTEDRLGMVGPNESEKSTLLRVLAGPLQTRRRSCRCRAHPPQTPHPHPPPPPPRTDPSATWPKSPEPSDNEGPAEASSPPTTGVALRCGPRAGGGRALDAESAA